MPGMSAKVFNPINVGDDRLLSVFYTTGQNEILLVTAAGQAIRFNEDEVRPTGLSAGGMRGIKLMPQKDRVVGAEIVQPDTLVWNITDDGVAKTSSMDEYPAQGRAGSGVISMRLPNNSREVVAATLGSADEQIIILTTKNKPLLIKVGKAPLLKRGKAGGDIALSLGPKEAVAKVIKYQRRIQPVEETDTSSSNGNGTH